MTPADAELFAALEGFYTADALFHADPQKPGLMEAVHDTYQALLEAACRVDPAASAQPHVFALKRKVAVLEARIAEMEPVVAARNRYIIQLRENWGLPRTQPKAPT